VQWATFFHACAAGRSVGSEVFFNTSRWLAEAAKPSEKHG
jgi:hypothetical protein